MANSGGGNNTFPQTFTVTVGPANANPPTVSTSGGSLNFLEGSAPAVIDPGVTVGDTDPNNPDIVMATVAITGNYAGAEDVLSFTPQSGISLSSSTPSSLTFSGSASPAAYQALLQSVTYQDQSNNPSTKNRTVTFSVTSGTAGGTAASDGTRYATRTIVVTAVNAAPTLSAITSPISVPENGGLQTVNLTGLSTSNGQSQTLTISATSNNTLLIPSVSATYTNPNMTGTLVFTPAANLTGSATITVFVTDGGNTNNGGSNSTTQTFVVNVTAVNQAPTLNAITSPQPILESAAPTQQTINLSGITAGPGDTQILTVNATSSNPSLIPNVSAAYTSPNTTGTLNYTPVAGASGTAVITVTVMDNGPTGGANVNTFSRTFNVVVTPVNQAPTLAPITPPASISENTTGVSVNLMGISDGDGGTQVVSVFATSSNPSLILPSVTFNDSHQANQTGSVNITPLPNQSGTAVITVTVMDNGGTANGGVNSVSQNFTVTVTPVNQAPTLNAISDPTPIAENTTTLQTVNLTGIAAGPGDTTGARHLDFGHRHQQQPERSSPTPSSWRRPRRRSAAVSPRVW